LISTDPTDETPAGSGDDDQTLVIREEDQVLLKTLLVEFPPASKAFPRWDWKEEKRQLVFRNATPVDWLPFLVRVVFEPLDCSASGLVVSGDRFCLVYRNWCVIDSQDSVARFGQNLSITVKTNKDSHYDKDFSQKLRKRECFRFTMPAEELLQRFARAVIHLQRNDPSPPQLKPKRPSHYRSRAEATLRPPSSELLLSTLPWQVNFDSVAEFMFQSCAQNSTDAIPDLPIELSTLRESWVRNSSDTRLTKKLKL
jgi:hypothetical protein